MLFDLLTKPAVRPKMWKMWKQNVKPGPDWASASLWMQRGQEVRGPCLHFSFPDFSCKKTAAEHSVPEWNTCFAVTSYYCASAHGHFLLLSLEHFHLYLSSYTFSITLFVQACYPVTISFLQNKKSTYPRPQSSLTMLVRFSVVLLKKGIAKENSHILAPSAHLRTEKNALLRTSRLCIALELTQGQHNFPY